jgi:[NiFe] hydrogenase assembly HybE family chaperone
MKSSHDLGLHPRVLALIERFREIDAEMRDLPIYNDKVAIEAIGFRPFGDAALLGVVLTPWFMNVIVLPIKPTPMDMAEVGRTVSVELPAGQRTFTIGGDEAIGLYKFHSLQSPVLGFTLPGQARAAARRMFTLLTTPPAPAAQTAAENRSATALDRRALLFGRRLVSNPSDSVDVRQPQ